MKAIDKLGLVISYTLLFIFALIVFHAPFSVFFSQFFYPELIKSWKEILLLILIPLVFIAVVKTKSTRKLASYTLLQLIGIYAVLHVILLFIFSTSNYQKLAGLAIDLRYLLFFVLVFCTVWMWPQLRKSFLKVGAVAAGLSLAFSVLQAAILPRDFLKYVGYSKETIEPYLTVDKNPDFVRINGTLRGPNPLGAYMLIIINLLSAWVFSFTKKAAQYKWLIVGAFLFMLTALWASYSRSAWIAAALSLAALVITKYGRKVDIKYWLITLAVLLCITFAFFGLKNSSFVQNVLLHNNPNGGNSLDSNEAHVNSLETSIKNFINQPYGQGIGSTGSASLKSSAPLIIENQYLFIAHETGWFGLGLFVAIYALLLGKLYKFKKDWLSLGLFSSGVGLAIIGLVLPVWVDDTVSLVWFGLVAVALASNEKILKNKRSQS